MNRGATSQRHGGLPTCTPLPPAARAPPARRSTSTGGSHSQLHEHASGGGKRCAAVASARWCGCAWHPSTLATVFCGLLLGAWTVYWAAATVDSARATAPAARDVRWGLNPAGGGEPDSGWFARLTSAGSDAATHLALTRAGIWGVAAGRANASGATTHDHRDDSSSETTRKTTTTTAKKQSEKNQNHHDGVFLAQTKRRCGEAARVGILGLPMYAYRDAMADRSPSNVRDIARRAAEDRHDFYVTGEGSRHTGEKVMPPPRAPTDAVGGGGAGASPLAESPSAAAFAAPRLRRLIATHHKTGTALMHDIFKTIAGNFSGFGRFADIRDMEDHPDKFTAEDKASAASAGIVLDYHLGKRLPDFMLTLLKPSPSTTQTKRTSSDDAAGGGAAAGRGSSGADVKAHEDGTISASEVAAAAAADEAFAAARDCTSLTSFFTSAAAAFEADARAEEDPPRASDDARRPRRSDRGGGGGGGGDSYRMVHVVRNPVEVLISGFLYHRRRPTDEGWLFEPVKELSGMTYADHLSAATPEQAMMAEIGMADDELRMLALAYRDVERDPNAINVKLEDLFHRFDDTVRRVLRFLQFPEADIPAMAEAAKAFDVRRWSSEELRVNEHFTQREDRTPYVAVIQREGFLNKTMSYMRYAMGYEDLFPRLG